MKRLPFQSALVAAGLLAALACSDSSNGTTGGSDGTGQLAMLNALTPGTAAILQVDGAAATLPASGTSGTAILSAGSHQFQLSAGGQVLLSRTITIANGTHSTAVLSGSAASAMLLVNTMDTAAVPLTDAAKMRLVHTVPDAPSYDAYLFLTTQAADSAARFVIPFNYGTGTNPEFPGYGVRPPGDYLVWLKAAGTDNVLVQGGPFTVHAGDVYSFVLARNDAGTLEIRAVKEH
jgi:hypothetical protein